MSTCSTLWTQGDHIRLKLIPSDHEWNWVTTSRGLTDITLIWCETLKNKPSKIHGCVVKFDMKLKDRICFGHHINLGELQNLWIYTCTLAAHSQLIENIRNIKVKPNFHSYLADIHIIYNPTSFRKISGKILKYIFFQSYSKNVV